MNRTLVDLWVGFFVALGLVAIVFLALKVANQSSFRAPPSLDVGSEEQMLAAGDTIEFTSSALLLEKLIGALGLNKASLNDEKTNSTEGAYDEQHGDEQHNDEKKDNE